MSPLSINMIFFYLCNRAHQTKIKEYFSKRSRIEHGVPQGLILGPLLFNTDFIDLFCECEESNIASYADDTTSYTDLIDLFCECKKVILLVTLMTLPHSLA